MMRNYLHIDGQDTYTTYGVYLTDGSYKSLIAYPASKEVTTDNWLEEDGIEADLSEPKLNTRELTLNFAYGRLADLPSLIDLICDGAYHTFAFPKLGRTYTLRLSQMPSLRTLPSMGTLSLKFADDRPLYGYTYQAPESTVATCEDYFLDTRPLTDYGCRVLKGTLDEFSKMPATKVNLLQNNKTMQGAIYDDDVVLYQSKDVKLQLLMRAETLTELWRNYDALLYDLTRANLRQVKCAALDQVFPCYYKSSSVSRFYPDGKIWLEFDITLTITGNLRPEELGLYLAAESADYLTTEDEKYFDMMPTL